MGDSLSSFPLTQWFKAKSREMNIFSFILDMCGSSCGIFGCSVWGVFRTEGEKPLVLEKPPKQALPHPFAACGKTPNSFSVWAIRGCAVSEEGVFSWLARSGSTIHDSVSFWLSEGSAEPEAHRSHQVPHLQPNRHGRPRALQRCSPGHPEGTGEADI